MVQRDFLHRTSDLAAGETRQDLFTDGDLSGIPNDPASRHRLENPITPIQNRERAQAVQSAEIGMGLLGLPSEAMMHGSD